MPDNIEISPGAGAEVAADEINGVLYQRVKMAIGADGAATDLPGSASEGAYVTLATLLSGEDPENGRILTGPQRADADSVLTTFNLTASGAAATVNTKGYRRLAVQIAGTFTATVTFEATVDGSNWIAVRVIAVGADPTASASYVTTATAAGLFAPSREGGRLAAFDQFRVRVSAYTSGTVAVAIRREVR